MAQYLSPEGERLHAIKVLKKVKYALTQDDAFTLKKLSNFTIHSASSYQDDRSILIMTIVYTLSKILERKDNLEIKNWKQYSKEFIRELSFAQESLEKKENQSCIKHLKNARKALTKTSPKLRSYIKEVLRKASINKASKIHEHGISLERTASLLGITKWELSEYIGQSSVSETKQNITLNVKQRAKIALEFLTK